jgi:hypothetical protein
VEERRPEYRTRLRKRPRKLGDRGTLNGTGFAARRAAQAHSTLASGARRLAAAPEGLAARSPYDMALALRQTAKHRSAMLEDTSAQHRASLTGAQHPRRSRPCAQKARRPSRPPAVRPHRFEDGPRSLPSALALLKQEAATSPIQGSSPGMILQNRNERRRKFPWARSMTIPSSSRCTERDALRMKVPTASRRRELVRPLCGPTGISLGPQRELRASARVLFAGRSEARRVGGCRLRPGRLLPVRSSAPRSKEMPSLRPVVSRRGRAAAAGVAPPVRLPTICAGDLLVEPREGVCAREVGRRQRLESGLHRGGPAPGSPTRRA